VATPRRISDIRPLFTNLAQTSHYELKFGGLPGQLIAYLAKRGVSSLFVNESAGLLCSNASLPTTVMNSKIVDGNFTGIQEKFAYSRSYGETTLTFYVDSDYLMVKFLESWMEFIASGSHNPIGTVAGPVSQSRANYFIRMQYPEDYKTNYTKIVKFDRNYESEIEYTFFGLWPSSIGSIDVSYNESQILTVSATFSYDRYIAGPALSINGFAGDYNNKKSNTSTKSNDTSSSRTLIPIRGQSGVVFYDPSIDTIITAKVNNRFFTGTGQPTFE